MNEQTGIKPSGISFANLFIYDFNLFVDHLISEPINRHMHPVMLLADASTVNVAAGRLVFEQGDYVLPVSVRGVHRGHAGSTATLAAFFYAPDGPPLSA